MAYDLTDPKVQAVANAALDFGDDLIGKRLDTLLAAVDALRADKVQALTDVAVEAMCLLREQWTNRQQRWEDMLRLDKVLLALTGKTLLGPHPRGDLDEALDLLKQVQSNYVLLGYRGRIKALLARHGRGTAGSEGGSDSQLP